MSGLYPDESYCTSEIGTLIFKPKSEWTGTARVVDITTVKGIAGTHNNYHIEFKLVPRQLVDIDQRIFNLTTRFRELDKLHKDLQKTHKQLYLRGIFPPFAPSKLIGAGNPAVLEERRHATEVFLNFVLDNEVLRKSTHLHQFLDKAVEQVHTALPAEEGNYSTIETGTDPRSLLESPAEEQHENGVGIAGAASGEIDFQFPEIALAQPADRPFIKYGYRRQFPKLKMDLEGYRPNTSDYLVRAGILLSTAQKAEAENEFELAFQCYKNAAKNLNEGLRTETDAALRNNVKLKAAKYIVRAEQLFRTYLSYDGSAFNLDGLLADSLHLHDPTIFAFKCSNSSLKDYSVVNVLPSVKAQNKVLLMEEKTTGNRYVLKFLDKGVGGPDGKIVLPTSVPHMVQLYKFFETEDHILLLLEYAPNGRLFDFLNIGPESKKLKRSKTSPLSNGGEVTKKPRRYSYTGQRLLFSVGFDCDRVAALRDEQQSTEDPTNCEIACAIGEDCMAEQESTANGAKAQEFFITKSTVEEAPEVEWEELPASVKFRDPPIKQTNDLTSSESLSFSLKQVRDLLLARSTWTSGIHLPESLVVHWTAQIVSFLYMLHHQYDEYVGALFPSNLLLDPNGNLLLTYHGRWLTPNLGKDRGNHYYAPESNDIKWQPCASGDIYSFGCMLFELTMGRPLHEAAPHGLSRDSMELVNEKGQISLVCADLLLKLLAPQDERCTLEEIRTHAYYAIIDWSLYDNPHASAMPNKSRVIPAPDLTHLDPLLTDLTQPDTSTNISELDPETETASTSHNFPVITSS